MPKRMRKYLRKPKKKSTTSDVDWRSLYRKAKNASAHLAPEANKKVKFLRSGAKTPEKTLRRLSIICEEDIKREFG